MTETTIRGHKGMTSVKEMPVLQDGPPPGGFPAVRYGRRIANSGPSGAAVLLVSSAVIGWGMYQVGQGNIYRRFATFKGNVILRRLEFFFLLLLRMWIQGNLTATLIGPVVLFLSECLRDGLVP